MENFGAEVMEAAQTLWDYHHLDLGLPKSADVIVALGSHDVRTAERASDLWHQGVAPWVVTSGGYGKIYRPDQDEPEAMTYRDVAVRRGVSETEVLVEPESTNTGENLTYTRALLEDANIEVHAVVLVCTPHMRRRSWATAVQQWREPQHYVTSPLLSLEEFPNHVRPLRQTIELMVGDLQSIVTYPAKGFQVSQEVPRRVLSAYEHLCARGFTRYLKPD